MPSSRPTRSKQRSKELPDNSKSKFTLQSFVRAFPSAPELTYFQPGLLGRISSVGRGGPLAISLRQNIMSFYAQDIWQARPNLTVTLGLRWEPLLPEADKNGIGVRFDRAAYVAGLKSQVYLNAPPGFFYYGDQAF